MEDPLTLFESFPQRNKQGDPSLHFNVVLLNIKPNADSMMVEGCKWLDSIHISKHI